MDKRKIKELNEIRDIFNGEYLNVWEDNFFVYISFPYVVVNIPKEEWIKFKKDMEKLSDL